MKPKDEILFWKKSLRLIKKNYGGKHCHKKDMDFRCAGCLSGLMESWVDMHLDFLIYEIKKKGVIGKIKKKYGT